MRLLSEARSLIWLRGREPLNSTSSALTRVAGATAMDTGAGSSWAAAFWAAVAASRRPRAAPGQRPWQP